MHLCKSDYNHGSLSQERPAEYNYKDECDIINKEIQMVAMVMCCFVLLRLEKLNHLIMEGSWASPKKG